MTTAKLILDGKEYEFPTVVGTENEVGVDFTKLRPTTGAISVDPGYGNTGSCASTITFIDGEKGILRYRGYPIEEIAKEASFTEVCFLLIYGHLPTQPELDIFNEKLTYHSMIHEAMKQFFDDFPVTAHPMMVLSAMIASLSAFYPRATTDEDRELNIIRLIAKASTIAAFSYKKSVGQPFIYPRNDLTYTENFLHMMFAIPAEPYVVPPVLNKALNLLLILHADHEQNCSTSTVRMVGSSQANLFASISAGVMALWGPLHGGANQKVIEMLQRGQEVRLQADGLRPPGLQELRPAGHAAERGGRRRAHRSGHRRSAARHRQETGRDRARGRAMGIPTEMFTVMFALGRLPGWISQWKEMREDPHGRISRPRQIYTGEPKRPYVPMKDRKATVASPEEKLEPVTV
jgi:citrate synthase